MNWLVKFLFELFLIVRFSGMTTPSISNNFLIQDKFCRNVYNQTEHFCQHINDDNISEATKIVRDEIFSSTSKFTQVQ